MFTVPLSSALISTTEECPHVESELTGRRLTTEVSIASEPSITRSNAMSINLAIGELSSSRNNRAN